MLNKGPFWLAALVAIVAAAWFRYQADAEPPAVLPSKLAFITGGSGNYWELTAAGAREAGKKLGVEVVIRMPQQEESTQEQNEILTNVATSDFDGVAVSPLDSEGQVMVINTLASRIPVVTFDSDASTSARHGFVGTSNFSAGLMAGTLVKKAIPEGGKIAVFMTNLTKQNMQDRQAGFKTRIEESPVPDESTVDPRYEVIGYFTDGGNNDDCAAEIRRVLAEHEDVACFVGMNSRHGPLFLSVLGEEDKLDSIKLVTFDTEDATLEGIEQGHISATVAQDPFRYGFDAIQMLVGLCDGDNAYLPVVGRGAIHVSVEPLTADKISDFRDRVQARTKKMASKLSADTT